jgi:hypothetical protein
MVVNMTSYLQLTTLRVKMVGLCLHSPIRLHGVVHRDSFAGSLFPVAISLTELLWIRIMLYETNLLKSIIILTRHLPEFVLWLVRLKLNQKRHLLLGYGTVNAT